MAGTDETPPPVADGPEAAAARARLVAACRSVVAGRDVVLLGMVVRGAGTVVDALAELDARRVMVIATGEGTGPELPASVTRMIVPVAATSMTEELFGAERLGNRLDRAGHAVLDAFDPDRRAVVIPSPFVTEGDLGGRRIRGRRVDWADLEDKATVDELFTAAGVTTLPAEITDPAGAASAAARIDRGAGTVWAGGGRNGGAEYVRWVVTDAEARAAAHALAGDGLAGPGAGRVRVAPFVDGVPSSIAGFVTADGVAVLRPTEMLVLRRGRRFVYSGCSTLHDPPGPVRAAMRDAARRVGEELRRRVDFRGGFSVDGIVSGGRWWPTEVNTRLAGSAGCVAQAVPEVLPLLLQARLLSGDEGAPGAADIETALLGRVDARRALTLARVVSGVRWSDVRSTRVRVVGRTAIPVDDGPGDDTFTVLAGPSAVGGVVLARVSPGQARPGGPAGPLAASLLDLAAERFGADTGGLEAAPTC